MFWDEAHGTTVTDVDGNSYLDFTSAFGVASIGHSHPSVIQAIVDQSSRLIHGMGDVHPTALKVALCTLIKQLSPVTDARIILSLNGGDAVESALKTCMLGTGKRGILAFHGGYHGLSYGALETTHRADFRNPFLQQLGGFAVHLPFGCELEMIELALKPETIGGIILEPIQGRGGIVCPPAGWLRGVRDICTRRETLLVLDEIFTGWGRTGDLFACVFDNVVPDIHCVGKAMGGGLPISACVASSDLMGCWGESKGEALHTSTFLGNPLSCAAAVAAIRVIVNDNLSARAFNVGAYTYQLLEALMDKYPNRIYSVRGRGLMLGIELETPEMTRKLVEASLKRGVIFLPGGDGRILELIPPLTVSTQEIDTALSVLESSLKDSG